MFSVSGSSRLLRLVPLIVGGMFILWYGHAPRIVNASSADFLVGGLGDDECRAISCDDKCNKRDFGTCFEKAGSAVVCLDSVGQPNTGCDGGPEGVACPRQTCSEQPK